MSVTLELILNRFDGKLMLNVEDLSKITGLSQITIRNQLSLGTFAIPTYLDGSRRFARADDWTSPDSLDVFQVPFCNCSNTIGLS